MGRHQAKSRHNPSWVRAARFSPRRVETSDVPTETSKFWCAHRHVPMETSDCGSRHRWFLTAHRWFQAGHRWFRSGNRWFCSGHRWFGAAHRQFEAGIAGFDRNIAGSKNKPAMSTSEPTIPSRESRQNPKFDVLTGSESLDGSQLPCIASPKHHSIGESKHGKASAS
jgi:hypothetical protein